MSKRIPGIIVLIGAQWGDEGKGKGADIEAEEAAVVARFQGGPNAGHTLVVNGKKVVLHQVPSGILHPKPICLLGGGMVIDMAKLAGEIQGLVDLHTPRARERILIAKNAHLILPIHCIIDAFMDRDNRIGTTKAGIGPTYADKHYRTGLRAGDILLPNFEERVQAHCRQHVEEKPALAEAIRVAGSADFEQKQQKFLEACRNLRQHICDAVDFINTALERGETILAEGAQGTLLDIDHGNYPFVTGSNSTIGGVCTGLGVPISAIERVIGIAKAYTTRVGSGPFPTELQNDIGTLLQERGGEFGATTGRPRRCGWLDIPQLKFANRINGFTEIQLTKLDILDTLEEIMVCTGYSVGGAPVTASSVMNRLEDITPQYVTLPGWRKNTCGVRSFADLPKAAQGYVEWIQEQLGVPVTEIGIGPGREHNISR